MQLSPEQVVEQNDFHSWPADLEALYEFREERTGNRWRRSNHNSPSAHLGFILELVQDRAEIRHGPFGPGTQSLAMIGYGDMTCRAMKQFDTQHVLGVFNTRRDGWLRQVQIEGCQSKTGVPADRQHRLKIGERKFNRIH